MTMHADDFYYPGSILYPYHLTLQPSELDDDYQTCKLVKLDTTHINI
jgi:hypothetical protein